MKKLFNFRPLFLIAVLICLSLLSVYLISVKKCLIALILPILLLLILVLTIINCHVKKKGLYSSLIFSIVAILLCIICAVNFSVTLKDYNSANLNGQTKSVSGRVILSIKEDYGLKVCLSNAKAGNKKLKYKTVVYVFNGEDIELGDKLFFTAPIQDFSIYFNGNFSSSYISDGIKYFSSIDYKDLEIVKGDKTVFEKANLAIKNSLELGLGEREFPVAYAMLTGNSDYIDQVTLEGFRASGIAHVFAVSGLHVGVLAGVIRFLLKFLKLKVKIRAPITIALVFFYSGICGFTASVIRASIMISVLLLSEITGRKYDGLSSLGAAAIMVLLVNPVQLFGVGFQLSFGVVLGILLLSKSISKIFRFLPESIAISIGTVISSTLSSSLILLGNFGRVSLVSVAFNLVFIPVSSLLFVIILASSIIGMIFPYKEVFFIANYSLKFIITVIRVFDYSVLTLGGIYTGAFSIAYYLCLLFSSPIINLKCKVRACLCTILALVFISGTVINTIDIRQSTKITVSSSTSFCTTLIETKEENLLIVSYYSSAISTNKLNRIVSSKEIKQFDKVIVLKTENNLGLNGLITSVNALAPVKEVYTFNQNHVDSFDILSNGFYNTEFYYVQNGETVLDDISFKCDVKSYLTIVSVEGKKIGVFAKTGDTHLTYLPNTCDVVIAFDREDVIYSNMRPNLMITYFPCGEFFSAEEYGNFNFRIGKKGKLIY